MREFADEGRLLCADDRAGAAFPSCEVKNWVAGAYCIMAMVVCDTWLKVVMDFALAE
jgi:hypothetical protein